MSSSDGRWEGGEKETQPHTQGGRGRGGDVDAKVNKTSFSLSAQPDSRQTGAREPSVPPAPAHDEPWRSSSQPPPPRWRSTAELSETPDINAHTQTHTVQQGGQIHSGGKQVQLLSLNSALGVGDARLHWRTSQISHVFGSYSSCNHS